MHRAQLSTRPGKGHDTVKHGREINSTTLNHFKQPGIFPSWHAAGAVKSEPLGLDRTHIDLHPAIPGRHTDMNMTTKGGQTLHRRVGRLRNP